MSLKRVELGLAVLGLLLESGRSWKNDWLPWTRDLELLLLGGGLQLDWLSWEPWKWNWQLRGLFVLGVEKALAVWGGCCCLGDQLGLAVLGTLKTGLAIQGLFGHISFLQKND